LSFDTLILLNALTALIVIIDPAGTALIFNALTGHKTWIERAAIAAKSVVISMCLLIVFAHYGQPLLGSLGISIESLRIAGGLLLFYTAFHMVTKKLDFSVAGADGDISVYPMSVPLIAGPGSMTMAVLLYSGARSTNSELNVLLAILGVGFITFIALCSSLLIKKLIGRTGDEILRRFLGVLLAALAIQFVMDGISAFVPS